MISILIKEVSFGDGREEITLIAAYTTREAAEQASPRPLGEWHDEDGRAVLYRIETIIFAA